MPDSLVGRTLGSYRVEAEVGRGGMAQVFRAHDEALRRDVAIKVMRPGLSDDPQFFERFQREARAIASLQHPNILPVYGFGEENGQAYIVTMYVPGRTLADYLRERPPLASVLPIIEQIASALDFAHRRGIVHRDIKPANVLLREGAESPIQLPWALLSDFGIAKIVREEGGSTIAGQIIGTPEYMSPEQWQGGEVDGRSDLYALGIILYEAAAGRAPFKADSPIGTGYLHINAPLPPPRSLGANVPKIVEDIIFKATAKKPADRYQSATAMADALAAATQRLTGKSIRQLSIPLPASVDVGKPIETVAAAANEVGTAIRGATEVVGDRVRGATEVVGEKVRDAQAVAGERVKDAQAVASKAGHAVSDVAGHVVRIDWPGAFAFVARRLIGTVVAVIALFSFVAALVLGTDARGQLAAVGGRWGFALSGQPTDQLIGQRLGPTLELTLLSLVAGLVGGLVVNKIGSLVAGQAGCVGGLAGAIGRILWGIWLATPAYVVVALIALPVYALSAQPFPWTPPEAGALPHLTGLLVPGLAAAFLGVLVVGQRLREEYVEHGFAEWRYGWARWPGVVLRVARAVFWSAGPVIGLVLVIEAVLGIPGLGVSIVAAPGLGDMALLFDAMTRIGLLVLVLRFAGDLCLFFERAFAQRQLDRPAPGGGAGAGTLALAAGFLLFIQSLVLGLLQAAVPDVQLPFPILREFLASAFATTIAAAPAGFLAAFLGAILGLLIGLTKQIRRFGPLLSDLLAGPFDGVAALPLIAIVVLEPVLVRRGAAPVVATGVLLFLVLAPRAVRLLLRWSETERGAARGIGAFGVTLLGVIASALIIEATLGLVASASPAGRLGGLLTLTPGSGDVLAGLAVAVLTPLVIAGWLTLADGVAGVFGLRLRLPWSELAG